MFQKSESHTSDLIFTLGLFCVFAASAFLLVMIGVQVYQTTARHMQDTYSTRTALSYVAEKLRRHDRSGAVELTELEGVSALRLTDQVGDALYDTYIYSDGEYLREMTVRRGAEPGLALGEKVLQVSGFAMRMTEQGFLEFSAGDSQGRTVRLLMHLRSDGA